MAQIILGVAIGAGVVSLIWLAVHLLGKIRSLEARIKDMEAFSRKRMPYEAQEQLLDAMAALDKITMDVDVLQAIKENARAHIINALQVGTTRQTK